MLVTNPGPDGWHIPALDVTLQPGESFELPDGADMVGLPGAPGMLENVEPTHVAGEGE